jgi:hypothetical protein
LQNLPCCRSGRPDRFLRPPALTALGVATAESYGAADGVQGYVNFWEVRQDCCPPQAAAAEHLTAAAVEEVDNLIFDGHRHGTLFCCGAA